jgi:hypothetical protein
VVIVETDELPTGLIDATDPEYEECAGEETTSHRRRIVVIVNAPKDPEPKRFRFKLDETVGEAAKVAAKAFDYEVGTPSFQTPDGTVLDRNLTLEAAGVHNREHLELVDAGGGV